jgi:hypothetical protein
MEKCTTSCANYVLESKELTHNPLSLYFLAVANEPQHIGIFLHANHSGTWGYRRCLTWHVIGHILNEPSKRSPGRFNLQRFGGECSMADQNQTPKWVVTLSGGEWGTVKYGVVEYLRKRPKMRALTATVGLIWAIGWLASTAGFRWHFTWFPTISLVFMTPTLLWLAVVSGPDFGLKFKDPDPPKTPVPPDGPDAVIDPEGFGVHALNKSYTLTEGYARCSFRWALVPLIAGTALYGLGMLINSGVVKFGNGLFLNSLWVMTLIMFSVFALLILRTILMFLRAATLHDRLLDFQKGIISLRYQGRLQEQQAPPKKEPASLDISSASAKLIEAVKAPTGSD